MVIEAVHFSFPIDFLKSLLHQNNLNVRYFRASATGKGAIISSSDDRTNYEITFNCQNSCANLNISGDFSHKGKLLRFSFDEWSEDGDLNANSASKSQESDDVSPHCVNKTQTRRSQKRAIIEERSISPKAKVKKTNCQTQSYKHLTEKRTSQNQRSTFVKTGAKLSKEENGLNLRPRVAGRNWSVLRDESEEDLSDGEDTDNEHISKTQDSQEEYGFPNGEEFLNIRGLKKILPKPGKLKPAVSSLVTIQPKNMQSTKRIRETEISTYNKPSMFPLMPSPGTMKLVVGEKQSDGKSCQYCLVSSNEVDKKAVPVFFYTNISKGVETVPGNLPEEFQIVPVSDTAAVPIVINIRKYEYHRRHNEPSLKDKLETFQAISGSKSSVNIDSHRISNKKNTLSKKLISLQNTVIAPKTKKIDKSTGKTFLEQVDQSESSSSDSEMDYEDEMNLIRIPELSVLYPSTFIPKKSYVSLKVGKEIPLLNFVISSTELLRCDKYRFYIQGTKNGVEGLVLLGPFAMSYNPHTHLSFIKQPQCLRRIPQAIYKRRRDRWLRKHDKKKFERSLTGAEGDCSVAFVDHDYLTPKEDTSRGEESKSCQRETTQNEQHDTEDLVLTSAWGIQNDAAEEQAVDSPDIDESQIPLISSLAEAMTTKLRKSSLAQPGTAMEINAETQGNVPEAVTFDSLPPVTVEATVNNAGIQLNCRVLRKQKPENQSEQAPVKPKEAPVHSGQTTIQSKHGCNVKVDNDDSLHTLYKYTCKYCLKLTVTNFALYDHIRFTHQDVPGYLEYAREVQRKEGIRCEYCQKETIFYSQDGLRTHTNFHHPEKVKGRSNKVDKRTCPTCMKVFSQVKSLRKHIERIHVGVQYLCDKCPGIFKSEEALENHMKGKHDNIRNYTCHICGASYVTPTYLRKHVKHVHKKKDIKKKASENLPNEKPDKGSSRANHVKKCILCLHSFDPANLKKHMRQIHGVDFEKLKRCSDCSLTFNTRTELEYHRHSSHDVEYNLSCPYCGASYVLKNNFNEHIVTFHFSLNVHQCYICKQAHNKAYKLTEHMLHEHPGVKAQDEDHHLSCSHCLEKFPTHKSLVDHILSSAHHSVFPHNCLTCPQRFMHEHDLEHHIKVVHGMNEDVDFEIRCNSVEDKIVQMVVQCEVQGIDDLPAKAQLALKRLYSQGKTVMIVSKQEQKKASATEKKDTEKSGSTSVKKDALNTEPEKSMTNRRGPISVHTKPQNQHVDCKQEPRKSMVPPGMHVTSSPQVASTSQDPVYQVSSPNEVVSQASYTEVFSVPTPQDVHPRPSGPSSEVLRVYRMAVQSEEVARAIQTIDPHQGRQLQREVVEEQVLSVDDEFVVAEQIGRLDESGNIIEDRVVYVDYEPVPQEMLLNMLPQTYMQ